MPRIGHDGEVLDHEKSPGQNPVWMLILALFMVTFGLQTIRDRSETQAGQSAAIPTVQKTETKKSPRSRLVPAEIINAEVVPKQPADPLDGPPFVTPGHGPSPTENRRGPLGP